MIIHCLRRIGRLIAWVLLRGCRLLPSQGWSQRDIEVISSVLAITTFFLVGGYLYMSSGDSIYKDVNEEKLIQEYVKEKEQRLVPEDNIDDEANIIKVDGYVDKIQMSRIQNTRYKIIDTKKEKENKKEEQRKMKEDRQIEKDRIKMKKDSQERQQFRRQNLRRKDVVDNNIGPGEGKFREFYKKLSKLKNALQGDRQPPLLPNEKFDQMPKSITVYNLSTAVKDDYECLNLKIKPATKVCVYPVTLDVYVSYHIRLEGMWEPHIIKAMQKELSNNSHMGVIDIGANIGVYSLVAATMGHNVVAIEPYEENIKHLQKAAHLNNVTERITLLQNAVSDERRLIQLELPPDNQGGVAVNKGEDCTPGASCYETNTMFLDDIVHFVSFTKAIIKIDIEGHEHRAFQKASVLFDKIYIASIYMEWKKLRRYYGSETTNTVDKDLTFDLVRFFVSRDYTAYSCVTGARLKPGIWFSWPDDIIWRHKLSKVW